MSIEQIQENIIHIDEQLAEVDLILSDKKVKDLSKWYELEALLMAKKRKLLSDYEDLITL